MNLDQYRAELAEINDERQAKKNDLTKRYALSNRKANSGEIVEDHFGRVLAEKLGVTHGLGELPSVRYFGLVLKKNGEPRKDREKRWVYESNMDNTQQREK